jgi:hypothetical protein
MLTVNKKHHLLLLVFAFAFIYRVVLMLWETFPPGADIGLHNSVIYSITGSGNANFFYNFYHIGGGTSLTFPGYHIFTSAVILFTGLPEYVAHAVIVSLFSALIVLAAFLITKRVWSEPVAYVVAFLVAISRFDIEMLLWGGYPNVITLFLIPVVFYLYLDRERFSTTPFLAVTSILAGSIFLTHSLSAAMYVAITVLVVLFVVVKPKLLGTTAKTGLYWLLPIVLGAIIFSPFLIQAVPVFLSNNSTLTDNIATSAIKMATLSTRELPLELVLPLFGALVGFLIFSKKYFGRFVVLPTFLLVMWLFLPLILTQSYLVGFAIDFNRFLYFLILPLIIFIGILIEHGSEFFAHKIAAYRDSHMVVYPKKKPSRYFYSLKQKNVYAAFIVFFLLFSFLALPIFMGPIYNAGLTIQGYYQTMNQEGWEAIQWAKANTPTDSVFVSDALYGWWFSGFAQRRTYSAVDPQYLSINEEYEKTLFARTLLDTDYSIDNGLVQVRDDGGYLARHNPEVLATLNWTYFPYSFFNFDSDNVKIRYNGDQLVSLSQLEVKEMSFEADSQHALIKVTRGNDCFNYTQLTTVYQGLRFVNLKATIESTVPDVSLEWVDLTVECEGTALYNDKQTVALIAEGVKVFGQLIFDTEPLSADLVKQSGSEVVDSVNLIYSLNGTSKAEITILASAYSVTDSLQYYRDAETKSDYFQPIIASNLEQTQKSEDQDFKQVFDYQTEMQNYNVSYIACRVPEMYEKFSKDPLFDLVFINSEVAIFKVKGNIGQDG